MDTYFPTALRWLQLHLAEFGLRLFSAIAVVIVGLVLARMAAAAARAAMLRSPLRGRVLLVDFLTRTLRTVVVVFAGVVALGELGLEIGPLIAGIGITGFVVGFAFKDSLSNLAAGLLLLFYQPFDVDEVVEVGGVTGRVLSMSVATTELRRDDGKLAILPNSRVWNAPIINHSRVVPPAAPPPGPAPQG